MFFLNNLKQKPATRNNLFFVCLLIGLFFSSKRSRPSPEGGLISHLPVNFRNGILWEENSFDRCLLGNRRLRYGQNQISGMLNGLTDY